MNQVSPSVEYKKIANLENQIVVFSLRGERYGIPIAQVREVLEPDWYTIIPLAPNMILGAINHHGKIYSIIDISMLFFQVEPEMGPKKVILIEDDIYSVGLRVNKINEITFFEDDILEEGLQKISKSDLAYVDQIFQYKDEIINVINLEKILEQISSIIF